MDAIDAKRMTVQAKAVCLPELMDILHKGIEDRAKLGWNRVCIDDFAPEIYKKYSQDVLTEAFNKIREEGFGMNLIVNTINW